MNTLKVLATDSHVYNVKKNHNVEKNVMETRPVNPDRAIDQKLVEKSQRGDKKAFAMLVDKYQRRLTRLLSRMVRDQSEIEDIVQDSFIKAYRAINNFRGDSAFYTWLYRIGINTAKNHLVKLSKRPKAMNDVEVEDIENFDDAQDLRNLETPESSMMSKEIVAAVNQTFSLVEVTAGLLCGFS